MPTATHELITAQTLASNSSSVIFSNIPQTYKDLFITIQVIGSQSADIGVRFNSDTGSNYSRVYAYGTGSSTVSAADTSINIQRIPYMTATNPTLTTLQIFSYSSTDKHKVSFGRINGQNVGISAILGRWANVSAITSIEFYPEAGTINSGSMFYIYGIAG